MPSGKGAHLGDQPYFYSPWVSVEYLHTWLQGRGLPPLVSTSPPGTDGIVPGADILFGGGNVSGNRQAAGRLSFGGWFDPSERLGAGGRFFGIQTETIRFHAASDDVGRPLLARPIFQTWPGAPGGVGPGALVVTDNQRGLPPRDLSGRIDVVTHTDVLGAEGYLRYLLYCEPGRRLDLIGGYQFSRVDDSLQIDQETDFTPAIPFAQFAATDLFATKNKFHGGQIGLLGEFGQGPVILSLLAKAALGNMNEVVQIHGQSSVIDAGGATTRFNGGILALPTNMGTYSQDKFAWIPEAEVKLTFKLTQNLEASVGYDFMYWSTLALAGDQIETSPQGLPMVNTSQWFGGDLEESGGLHPALDRIKESSLWLHGLSVGITLRM